MCGFVMRNLASLCVIVQSTRVGRRSVSRLAAGLTPAQAQRIFTRSELIGRLFIVSPSSARIDLHDSGLHA